MMDHEYSMKNKSLVKEIRPPGQVSFPDPVLINDGLKHRIMEKLKDFIISFMNGIGIKNPDLRVSDLEEFTNGYRQNPARDGIGATRYNSLLWLFTFCRCLNPEVVVESGVYIGRSLWTLRKAAPDAKLYAFDINFKPLKFKDASIEYIETDWSQVDIKTKSENDLCYFDDHINNCLRIKQAHERGFKHLIFDDSPTVMNLHHFHFPGVPTAQMLLENNLREGDVITWPLKDKLLRYTYSESHTYNVRDLIDKITVLPSLNKYTGREGSDHFVYVRLKCD